MRRKRLCSINNCYGVHYAKGVCARHYRTQYNAKRKEALTKEETDYFTKDYEKPVINENVNNIVENLRDIVNNYNLTVKQISYRSGLSVKCINSIIDNKVRHRQLTMNKLVTAFPELLEEKNHVEKQESKEEPLPVMDAEEQLVWDRCQYNQEVKKDAGKLKYHLLPWTCLEELVRVYTAGAEIYGENTWQGVEKERYESALFRHLQDWRSGKKFNVENGVVLKTMSQVAWNAFALLWMDLQEDKK